MKRASLSLHHTHTHTSGLPLCILSSTEKTVIQQRDRERRKAVWL